ncbi:MAG: ankyrin repeat domain-containing protein [Verrucomicrobiota bacterium]
MMSTKIRSQQNKALWKAALCGRVDHIDFWLKKGADVNSTHAFGDTKGHTSLMAASFNAQTEAIKLLLTAGADINAQDEEGRTALMMTLIPLQTGNENMIRRHMKAMELLLDAGANINVQDESGYTPLMKASEFGCLEIVKFLLEKGADIETKNTFGDTALTHASSCLDGTEALRVLRDCVRKKAVETGKDHTIFPNEILVSSPQGGGRNIS